MNSELSLRPVFVGHGSTVYHSSLECPELAEARDHGVDWCHARSAHLSSLTACPACATLLMARLGATIGALPTRERARRGVPKLQAAAPV